MKRWLFILLMAFCSGLNAAEQSQFLTVTGRGATKVKATIAEVRLGVQVQGNTAINVQESLADQVKPVLTKLRQLKVDKLETGSMNIYPEYDNKANPPSLSGYRGSIEISFSCDAANAGPAIDAAIAAGANQMHGFSLSPSEDLKQHARISSLQLACDNALVEARAVLEALHLDEGEILQVSVEQVHVPGPIFRKNAIAFAAAAPQTELLDQEEEVSALVSMQIGFKPKEGGEH